MLFYCHKCNHCNYQHFPEIFTSPHGIQKIIISPLLKSHNLDPEPPANYRPISHLSFLSKVLEKVVAG